MAEKIVELVVEGMSCQHCVASVQKALDKLDGVGCVQVELEGKKVELVYDPDLVDLQIIREAIEEEGYQVK
ncbi:MAG: heavy-metal-associated domain-containing protein [Firmicutes bacterium]|nr:heavy-metal-associated domain-containing protein [Bacillota bacterium]